jgi:hypothetical protein
MLEESSDEENMFKKILLALSILLAGMGGSKVRAYHAGIHQTKYDSPSASSPNTIMLPAERIMGFEKNNHGPGIAVTPD